MTDAANPPAASASGPASSAPATSGPAPLVSGAAPPESAGSRWTKVLLAVALFAVASWLASSRWNTTSVDWYLGDLRRNPGDAEAYAAFASMGDRAMPRLEQELADADPNGRVVAVLAVSSIETSRAERALSSLATDEDPVVASNAVAAFASRKDGETARALRAALADARRPVRLSARRAAGERSRIPWWAFGRGEARSGTGTGAGAGTGTGVGVIGGS